MTIAELRKSLNMSLADFAKALGFKSRTHAFDLEAGTYTPSVSVALKIEELSCGKISAASLNKDVRLVEVARGLTAA